MTRPSEPPRWLADPNTNPGYWWDWMIAPTGSREATREEAAAARVAGPAARSRQCAAAPAPARSPEQAEFDAALEAVARVVEQMPEGETDAPGLSHARDRVEAARAAIAARPENPAMPKSSAANEYESAMAVYAATFADAAHADAAHAAALRVQAALESMLNAAPESLRTEFDAALAAHPDAVARCDFSAPPSSDAFKRGLPGLKASALRIRAARNAILSDAGVHETNWDHGFLEPSRAAKSRSDNPRNFWIELDIDGHSRVASGPQSKDGGFDLTIKMRDKGEVSTAMIILPIRLPSPRP